MVGFPLFTILLKSLYKNVNIKQSATHLTVYVYPRIDLRKSGRMPHLAGSELAHYMIHLKNTGISFKRREDINILLLTRLT